MTGLVDHHDEIGQTIDDVGEEVVELAVIHRRVGFTAARLGMG